MTDAQLEALYQLGDYLKVAVALQAALAAGACTAKAIACLKSQPTIPAAPRKNPRHAAIRNLIRSSDA